MEELRLKRKSIAALAATVVLTMGVGTSSYAWFTSSATSKDNKFTAGTLGITSDKSKEELASGVLALDNMQPGDSFTYNYTVDNMRDGKASTLPLVFKNVIEDNFKVPADSLLNAAKFDLTITNTKGATPQAKNLTGANYAKLKAELEKEATLNGGDNNFVTYSIKVVLPDVTGNEYQGKAGTVTMTATAKQVNGRYVGEK